MSDHTDSRPEADATHKLYRKVKERRRYPVVLTDKGAVRTEFKSSGKLEMSKEKNRIVCECGERFNKPSTAKKHLLSVRKNTSGAEQ